MVNSDIYVVRMLKRFLSTEQGRCAFAVAVVKVYPRWTYTGVHLVTRLPDLEWAKALRRLSLPDDGYSDLGVLLGCLSLALLKQYKYSYTYDKSDYFKFIPQ